MPARKKKRSVREVSAGSSKVSEDAQTIAITQKSEPRFPIVGIGASAGGLEALEELLDTMPADMGMAFVVVTHQHPGHTSLLPELLGRKTEMPVLAAADGMKLEANHVYVGSPGGYLSILNGTLHRIETGKQEAPRLPIDYFFRSLANDQKDRAICIILSGTGTDGTLGMKAIKGESGMAMVQQPQSAKYAGMPSSAVAVGVADYVLPPADMPLQLMAYGKSPYLTASPAAADMPTADAEPVQKIFALVRNRTGHDFSDYKGNTIHRRIERRMNVHQIRKPDEYVRYLQENPHELDILFKELLIRVTSFFRDAEAWEALGPSLEDLVQSRPENYTLRVWVPGCATGEEAFSLAIALRECMEKVNRRPVVQIFGTDLDAEAVENARAGHYPAGIAADVPPERLERDFIRDGGGYRIRKEIRAMTIFALQNVIKDPPFTKLDLLSCRNLLIYLNTDLQKKLLPIFHYALKPDGLLFLGPSETVGPFTDLFQPLDKRWKIFRRREGTTALRALPQIPAQPETRETGAPAPPAPVPPVKEAHMATQFERVLLNRFAPTSVVVNDRGDILFIHGRTGAYLEPAPGEPRNNILDMAREGLQIDLSTAMRECMRKGADVTREDIRIRTNGEFVHLNLTVAKITGPEAIRGFLLITFRPTPPAPPRHGSAEHTRRKAGGAERIERLERELQYTKESHQTTLEELETSNEQLKSANEELQSTNEELQSTNEELETSKEEMQSLNEELTTVNAELQSKVDELSQTNDDMQNLLNSTDIATVFLDNDLNIKRFTEEAKGLVMLRQTDVGRPISDLASNLEGGDLLGDCRRVLKTLSFKESEVRTNDGSWYLMRMMPYRTAENVIDGLVLTFVDIDGLKAVQRDLSRMSKVFMEALDPIVIVDLNGEIVDLNREAVRTYGFSREEMIGKPVRTVVPPQQQQQTSGLLARCREGESIRNVRWMCANKAGDETSVLLTLTLLTDAQGEPNAIAMSTRRLGE